MAALADGDTQVHASQIRDTAPLPWNAASILDHRTSSSCYHNPQMHDAQHHLT